jgi:predicted xylan-binding protein with Ca-dependent carbohydrate-binding module
MEVGGKECRFCNVPRNWRSLGLVIGIPIAVGISLPFVRPARQLIEPSDARRPSDVAQRVEQRLEQLSSAQGVWSKDETTGRAAGQPHPGVSQSRAGNGLPSGNAPSLNSQPASEHSEGISPPPMVVSDEGPPIQVPAHVPPIPMRAFNNLGGRTDGIAQIPERIGQRTVGVPQVADQIVQRTDGPQQPADRSAQKTDSAPANGDKASSNTDGTQPAGDKTSQKADNPQPATNQASQSTDGAQPATDKSGQKTDGGSQAAGDGGGNTQTDGSNNPDVVTIQAKAMEWDPNHAQRQNGEVFVFANSTLSTQVDLSSPATSVAIWAHGDRALGEWPIVQVSVNGTPMGEITVNSAQDHKFSLPIQADPGNASVELTFTNDFNDPQNNKDRNVYIRQMKITTTGH